MSLSAVFINCVSTWSKLVTNLTFAYLIPRKLNLLQVVPKLYYKICSSLMKTTAVSNYKMFQFLYYKMHQFSLQNGMNLLQNAAAITKRGITPVFHSFVNEVKVGRYNPTIVNCFVNSFETVRGTEI